MLTEEKLNLNLSFNRIKLEKFLEKNDLLLDSCSSAYCIFDNNAIIACACRENNVLKCFAVDERYRGENLLDKIISALLRDCYNEGLKTIFIFTKLKNLAFFKSYNFIELASGNEACLLYKSEQTIEAILENAINETHIDTNNLESKQIAAVVINANPFTLGHRYLIERAASKQDYVFVFVVEENKSFFSFHDRFFLVQENCRDISNVIVLPSTKFLISSATFPSYFLKEKEIISSEHALIDARIFGRYFVPKFKIKKRFLGDEELDASTRLYNTILLNELAKYNCEVEIIPRLKNHSTIVSASLVRKYFFEKNFEKIKDLVSKQSFEYLKQKANEK